jgi:hypothetical protein
MAKLRNCIINIRSIFSSSENLQKKDSLLLLSRRGAARRLTGTVGAGGAACAACTGADGTGAGAGAGAGEATAATAATCVICSFIGAFFGTFFFNPYASDKGLNCIINFYIKFCKKLILK